MVKVESLRTVRWDPKGSVVLVNQTQLPHRLTYQKCQNYQQVARAIRGMVVRGAPAIGVAAAMGLGLAALKSRAKTREQVLADLERAAEVLRATRPTAWNLFWAVERVMKKARLVDGSHAEISRAVVEEAKLMAEEDVAANHKIGEIGSALIEDGDTVLTHCK